MSYRSDDTFIIYPIYFDKLVSRSMGRRIKKKHCVEKPSLTQLSKAAKAAGLNTIVESEKAHPTRPWKQEGRILVGKKGSKQEVLYQLSKFL